MRPTIMRPFTTRKSTINIYDVVEIEDMTYDPHLEIYHYPCPCGDRFEISISDLKDNEDIAVCPSCSLMIRVVFELVRTFRSRILFAMACHRDQRDIYTARQEAPKMRLS